MRVGIPFAILTGLLTIALAAQEPAPAEWFQWRGPNRDGISPETGLLQEWPKSGPAQVWKIAGANAHWSWAAESATSRWHPTARIFRKAQGVEQLMPAIGAGLEQFTGE